MLCWQHWDVPGLLWGFTGVGVMIPDKNCEFVLGVSGTNPCGNVLVIITTDNLDWKFYFFQKGQKIGFSVVLVSVGTCVGDKTQESQLRFGF